MNQVELIGLQKEWYDRTDVKFELCKAQKGREMSFISKNPDNKNMVVRYLFSESVAFLQKHLKWFGYDKKLFNMYQSVAKLSFIPIFSYNLAKRLSEPKYVEFNQNYEKYIVGYDLFFDCDGKNNYTKMYENAQDIKKMLDLYKLPYYVYNSSKVGIHFRIPAEFMPPFDINLINNVVYNLQGIYEFECLDITVCDSKRLSRSPYSFSRDGSIVLPLDDLQFKKFSNDLVSVENVMKMKIRDRGRLIRTHNLDLEELKNNVSEFLNEYK